MFDGVGDRVVDGQPQITNQPASQSVSLGADVRFVGIDDSQQMLDKARAKLVAIAARSEASASAVLPATRSSSSRAWGRRPGSPRPTTPAGTTRAMYLSGTMAPSSTVSSLRVAICGAAAVPPELIRRLLDRIVVASWR